jgi:site-specific recombinase
MHLVGFTLATKQPSMTAATLAGAIPADREPDLGPLAELVARVHRSQLAAVLGNLGLVAPTAVLVDLLVQLQWGHPFLDRDKAQYVFHSLHPLHSGTVFYAALTGALLWSGSVVAGFVDNWVAYRRLPDAIAGSRSLGRVLTPEQAARVAHRLTHNFSGVAGNLALGVLLGCVPTIGHLFGAPLDVRHVTFATGSLALAVASVGFAEATAMGLLPALAGIALVGGINLVVSFTLALLVALRARDVRHASRLLPAVLARFRQGPQDFLWPRRDAPGVAS